VIAKWGNHFNDLGRIFAVKNWPALGKIGVKLITTGKRDVSYFSGFLLSALMKRE